MANAANPNYTTYSSHLILLYFLSETLITWRTQILLHFEFARNLFSFLSPNSKGKIVARICTGQSLTSFVTVTNKLGDERIVVFGGSAWVSMHKRNYDSFWLYWWRVSMYKRNHIENDVVMVATESQTNFIWSMAKSIELITNLWSYLWY